MLFPDGMQDKYDMIFPKPCNEEYTEEFYTLKNKYNTDDLYTFYTENKCGNDDIKLTKHAMFERDEYTLIVNGDGIEIGASCDDGYFRGFTSLRQLIRRETGRVQFSDVHDKPVFKQRGFMLDISRARKPKPEYIYELIDLIAGLKYNEFQLYMEDLCFKYSAYPQFTEDFDCLTPDDIVAIDKYCKDRFIELVPHQNGLGHMTAWLKKDELKHLAVTEDTINLLDPEALEVVDNIYGSLLPYFSSKRVHIGLDEALGLGMNQTEEECKNRGKDQVFMDWLNKLSDLCEQKYGKSVMFWADMIINHPECFDRIPQNAIPCAWGYEDIMSQFTDRHCRALTDAGIEKYYVTPATMTWLSFTGRFNMAEFNLRATAEIGEDNGAYGYLVTHWGDPDSPHNTVWSYLPMALGAQYSWYTGIKQQGGWRKPYFRRSAERYLDEYVFKAPISGLLRNLGNYYLLEPEPTAVSTMCTSALYMPVSCTEKTNFYDYTQTGEICNYEDIIRYVEREYAKVDAIEFDELYKREIRVNVKMVVLGAELIIAKINGGFTEEKAKEVIDLIDWIIAEHKHVWLSRDYENGIEQFLGVLNSRREEIPGFVKKS